MYNSCAHGGEGRYLYYIAVGRTIASVGGQRATNVGRRFPMCNSVVLLCGHVKFPFAG